MHRQDASDSAAFPCPFVKKQLMLVKLFSVIEAVSGTLGRHLWFQKANLIVIAQGLRGNIKKSAISEIV